ncbi:MAG: HlyD family secretion protein [Chitinophagales bacterium]|nr:HlyD family secretion protein [Chitinophagales bacterium]
MSSDKIKPIVILLAVIAVLAFCYWMLIHYFDRRNMTDDAQVDGNIVPVIARTDGFVDSILADDDQQVKKGDLLVLLDTTDLHLQLQQAQSSLKIAMKQLDIAQEQAKIAAIDLRVATSTIQSKQATVDRTKSDYERFSALKEKGIVSEQQYEAADEGYKKAVVDFRIAEDKQHQASLQNITASSNVMLAEETILQTQHQIALLKKQTGYASILAPSTGILSKRKIEEGQMVKTGAQLFTIVDNDHLWLTANFKETQLADMKPGDRVTIQIDAIPGKDFSGTIISFGGATGSKFALVPPDNATGNYVKVVQRIPVRIEFTDSTQHKMLRPGLSALVYLK